MTFNKWLDTLVEEKGLDTEFVFECEGTDWGTNYIPLGAVIEFIKGCDASVKKKVKDTLVMIDFENGS